MYDKVTNIFWAGLDCSESKVLATVESFGGSLGSTTFTTIHIVESIISGVEKAPTTAAIIGKWQQSAVMITAHAETR